MTRPACQRCSGFMAPDDDGFTCVMCGHVDYRDRNGKPLVPLALEMDLVPVTGSGRERGGERKTRRTRASRAGGVPL